MSCNNQQFISRQYRERKHEKTKKARAYLITSRNRATNSSHRIMSQEALDRHRINKVTYTPNEKRTGYYFVCIYILFSLEINFLKINIYNELEGCCLLLLFFFYHGLKSLLEYYNIFF